MPRAFGKIANKRVTHTQQVDFYTVPASTEHSGNLFVCNQTGSQASYWLAHASGATPADADEWIVKKKIIDPNDFHPFYGFAMGATEHLIVKASPASAISFSFSGMTIT